MLQAGGMITAEQLNEFMSSLDNVGVPSSFVNDSTEPFKRWDLRSNPMLNIQSITSETMIKQMGQRQQIIYCGDKDLSDQFQGFEDAARQAQNNDLTYDDDGAFRRRQTDDECRVRVPKNSKFATYNDELKFGDIEYDHGWVKNSPTEIELINGDLGTELLAKRIENMRNPSSGSFISYETLVKVMYSPKFGETQLMFFLDNPRKLETVNFNCPQLVLQDSYSDNVYFDLTCVVFKNEDGQSSDVAVSLDGEWVFYGGKDNTKEPPQHLRKKVPDNDLNLINAVPYILIFTTQI
jgi:hypothetical protein